MVFAYTDKKWYLSSNVYIFLKFGGKNLMKKMLLVASLLLINVGATNGMPPKQAPKPVQTNNQKQQQIIKQCELLQTLDQKK